MLKNRVSTSFARGADATAYAAGDHIANSTTAASVTPLTFNFYDPIGTLTDCSCTITPASSSLVITNLDFDLLIFAPYTDMPFAAGSYPADNAAMSISSSAFEYLLAVFSFNSSNWRNPAGAFTAGTVGWQSSVSSVRPLMQFDTLGSRTLRGVVQARAAWNPGAVVNNFHFVLGVSYP